MVKPPSPRVKDKEPKTLRSMNHNKSERSTAMGSQPTCCRRLRRSRPSKSERLRSSRRRPQADKQTGGELRHGNAQARASKHAHKPTNIAGRKEGRQTDRTNRKSTGRMCFNLLALVLPGSCRPSPAASPPAAFAAPAASQSMRQRLLVEARACRPKGLFCAGKTKKCQFLGWEGCTGSGSAGGRPPRVAIVPTNQHTVSINPSTLPEARVGSHFRKPTLLRASRCASEALSRDDGKPKRRRAGRGWQ